VITGILGWEPDRSSLETWVKKMVFWKVKEVKRGEYKRLKHERKYRRDARGCSIGENKKKREESLG